ncbi:hypothetical protein [Nocardioides sp. CFH 31398]|uniref:hypothetical protein n=1 Tax=Nocardioides sp. CFH 31398 TaxID=2919579 RepID=UPI001F051B0B|nr:hypothetical protein [Nocardioides sp. CFH 31398]MCH1866945.1 hypothetical protein [Nocardioides sp. CFH 31398]
MRRALLTGVAAYVALCVVVVGWSLLGQVRAVTQDGPTEDGVGRVVISTPSPSG